MVNADDLPDEIVQPLVQFGRALMSHARGHRDRSLAEHEQGVLAAWRGVAPALLEGVLQLATTGLEHTARPVASRCPGCQQRRGVQSQRKRQVQTRLGPIRLKRWASLLGVQPWLEPARPGAVSANEHGSGALAGDVGRNHHVS
jgi:sulfur relay (sulfurtransferase) complex TusBCD TusD component (DsrE family)